MEDIQQARLQKEKQFADEKEFEQVVQVLMKKNRKSKKYEMIKPDKLVKQKIKLKTILSRTNKQTDEIDRRAELFYQSAEHRIVVKNYDQSLTTFSHKLDGDSIKHYLIQIEKFIEAYRKFTIKNDIDVLSKVYEVILYSFTAPFMWKIREEAVNMAGRDAVRRNYPPFLIIGGTSGSGKTTLLEFIQLLVGQEKFFSYSEVSKANVLWDLFNSSNVGPILVDEIPNKFFTSKAQSKGEIFIKDVSNTIDKHHPVLIGTTNAEEFALPAQALSRIYYLTIDNIFDVDAYRMESSAYLDELLPYITNDLFKDFTYRFEQIIQDNEVEMYTDYLQLARTIFKHYYKETNLSMPDWFPEEVFYDYAKKGEIIWKEIYYTYTSAFHERDDQTISVKMEEINPNYARQNSMDRNELIDLLPVKCVKSRTHVLILDKHDFFTFIERQIKHDNWLYKILGRLKG